MAGQDLFQSVKCQSAERLLHNVEIFGIPHRFFVSTLQLVKALPKLFPITGFCDFQDKHKLFDTRPR